MKPIYSLFIMLSFAGQLRAQNDTTELFPYGDMNQWMVRVVDESLVIGGNTKYLYEITPGDTLKNNMHSAQTKYFSLCTGFYLRRNH